MKTTKHVNAVTVATLYASSQDSLTKVGRAFFTDLIKTCKGCAAIKQQTDQKEGEHNALKLQLRQTLQAKGLTEKSAQDASSRLAKVILFLTNGYTFKSEDLSAAYLESNEVSVAFWTKKKTAEKGANTKPKAAAVPASSLIIDPAKLQVLKEQAREEVQQETKLLAAAAERANLAAHPATLIPLMSEAEQVEMLMAIVGVIGVKKAQAALLIASKKVRA